MDMIQLTIQFDHLIALPLGQHPNIMIYQILDNTTARAAPLILETDTSVLRF